MALPPYSSVRWLKIADEKLPHIRSPCTWIISKPAPLANAAASPKDAVIARTFRAGMSVTSLPTCALSSGRKSAMVIFLVSTPGTYLTMAFQLLSD